MLTIVESLEHYRHMFEGLGQQITIYSDHHNLLWFTETKVYNRRQARWAEKLSKYDFVIHFRPGTQGGKPDALSRRPDCMESAKIRLPSPFLKPSQVDTSGIEITAVTMESANLGVDGELRDAIRDALVKDPAVEGYLDSPPEGFEVQEGLLLKDGLVYVPEDTEVKLRILEKYHDRRTAGHLGQEKTLELVGREFTWPGICAFVNRYVLTCDTCARNKTPRHRRHGQLRPLTIPSGPWQSVSMDFIVELPPSQGYDAIYVCVDRLTKMAHFIPTNSDVTAEQTADLYLKWVFKNHGLPIDIVSDRGTQFVSKFSRRLLELLDIKGNRSTAYHPESDGQTERVNQTLEQYLRIYCDFHQDDWSQLLPLAEFVYNNAKNSSTQMSPFYANYGYHPRASMKVRPEPSVYENPAAESLVQHLDTVHNELRLGLEYAQETYKRKFDRKAKPAPPFKVDDLVWLNRKNIATTRPSLKFDYKRFGPFKILKIVGDSKLAFQLELPPQWRIHDIFHASLLDPHHTNEIKGRKQPVPQPPDIVEGTLAILNSKMERRRLWYIVDWKGYGPKERTWEPAENLTHATDAVAAYYPRHPQRPSPQDIPNTPQPRGTSARKRGGTVTNVASPAPSRHSPRTRRTT
jgi:Integrase zinc binding domain/RNase H-like domain found in reverse transcriptase/Chromo (CHRromatin Organisation MOdifier) domain/Integrase core domain